jgi:hypothetical protein
VPRRQAAQRREPTAQRRSTFWRGPGPIIATVGGIVLLVVVFVGASRLNLFGGSTGPRQASQTADPSVVNAVAGVGPSIVDAVGTGGASNPLTRISGSALTGSGGKAEVLYIGAEWCPYCAAQRWAIAVALSHFGSLSGLHFTTSSSTDVFPDTHTLSFHGSGFSSNYVDFVPVELQDRNRNNLQTMNALQQQLWNTYNPDGSIPFLDLGNQYTMIGQGVSPDPLQGLTWQQIASALSNANSPVTKAIVGNSNYLTAAICKLAGAGSASICSDSIIKQIGSQLPG